MNLMKYYCNRRRCDATTNGIPLISVLQSALKPIWIFRHVILSGEHTPFNEFIRFALKIHAFIEKSFIMLSAMPFAIFPETCECIPIGSNLCSSESHSRYNAKHRTLNIEKPSIRYDNICTSAIRICADPGSRIAEKNSTWMEIGKNW